MSTSWTQTVASSVVVIVPSAVMDSFWIPNRIILFMNHVALAREMHDEPGTPLHYGWFLSWRLLMWHLLVWRAYPWCPKKTSRYSLPLVPSFHERRGAWIAIMFVFLAMVVIFLQYGSVTRLSTTSNSELRLRLGSSKVLQYRSYWRRTGMAVNQSAIEFHCLVRFHGRCSLIIWSPPAFFAKVTEYTLFTRQTSAFGVVLGAFWRFEKFKCGILLALSIGKWWLTECCHFPDGLTPLGSFPQISEFLVSDQQRDLFFPVPLLFAWCSPVQHFPVVVHEVQVSNFSFMVRVFPIDFFNLLLLLLSVLLLEDLFLHSGHWKIVAVFCSTERRTISVNRS